MEKLHPGARWSFRISGYFMFGFIGIFFGLWILPFWLESIFANKSIGNVVLFSILGYIVLIIIISEIFARMSYNRWFYEFTDEGLRLERGIIWKRYSNVPYERIQNVDVHRGIIARILGFSSLMIQTAGYSGQMHAEGYIPALEMHKAEKIRSFVMNKITNRRR